MIRKTMRVRDSWMHGTFEHDQCGWSLLALPVYFPLTTVDGRRGGREPLPDA